MTQPTRREAGRVFDMKRLLVSLAAVGLLVGLAAGPVSADRGTWNNWHVHDGQTNPDGSPWTDANGLTHYSVAFFPTILGVDLATYGADPAYCPNATMKMLLGTSASDNAVAYAGNCVTATTIIHLRVNPGNPAPSGWLTFVSGPTTFYYMLTSR
jgi:hypothetical protein